MQHRVLVVDDMAIVRRMLVRFFERQPNWHVVGAAGNGQVGLEIARQRHPDLITLDLEMPVLDGIETLEELSRRGNRASVVLLSGQNNSASPRTIRGLELGAFDFVEKPDGTEGKSTVEMFEARLRTVLNAWESRLPKNRLPEAAATKLLASSPAATPAPSPASAWLNALPPVSPSGRAIEPRFVLIGVSTGGPRALAEILPRIPSDFGLPILVVQHMPAGFTAALARSLALKCQMPVAEAVDGETVFANRIYIAPGGKQMKVASGPGRKPVIQITEEAPENNCRPAVDVLFRSVAIHFPAQSIAVILTGMGNDGTLGLQMLKRTGAHTIAQDEATSTVFGMPKEAIRAGAVDSVLPLDSIAGEILKFAKVAAV